jgi:3-(3-hydroxy-phenyl)propionate hydroxylase
MGELLALDEPRRHVVAMVTGLDIAYDLGGEHPLVGRRMPDVDLQLSDGTTTRVAELLHDAAPLLLDLRATGAPPVPAGVADLKVVAAAATGPWQLPLLGDVPAPDAVLVRSDGHVAWVGSPDDASLQGAVDRWFGSAS